MARHRLFVGLQLSLPLRKRLAREKEAWPTLPFRFTKPENLHVTLLFLGFRSDDELPEILARLEELATHAPSFELYFDHIGLAPETGKSKYLWLTGEANEELRLLRQNIERELGYLVPEHKSFRPHVTLANIDRRRKVDTTRLVPMHKKVSFVESVDSITLFESFSSDGERVYEVVAEFPLLA